MRTFACLCVIVWASCALANPVAVWTFETTPPSSAGPHVADEGALAASSFASAFHASPTSVYIARVGNGSPTSFNSITWLPGDYDQFQTSTSGFESIKILFDQTSSNRGPRDFEFEYSTDGSAFTTLANYSVLPNVDPDFWDPPVFHPQYRFNFDLSGIAGVNDRPNLFLRLVDKSTTSANGNTVLDVGTDRVDNFTVSGDPIANSIPLPPALYAAAFTVGALIAAKKKPSSDPGRRNYILLGTYHRSR